MEECMRTARQLDRLDAFLYSPIPQFHLGRAGNNKGTYLQRDKELKIFSRLSDINHTTLAKFMRRQAQTITCCGVMAMSHCCVSY